MKGRVVILDQLGDQGAACLMVDGQLSELSVDPVGDTCLPGAIFRAVADRPMKGQGGMFVKLAQGQSGFLRQIGGIAPGQRLLVQVTGPAEPGKALPVTTRLLLKSRYSILTPGAPGLNISRAIRDEAVRAELGALAATSMKGADETLGMILRSACEAANPGVVAEDLTAMRGLAEALLADQEGLPELLVDGPGAHDLACRDWLDPEPDDFADAPGGFEAHGVHELIAALRAPRVALPAGGHMMIESTRALVAVDVNTGADTSPAAALKANIAAARDLPRQLRLRGLGGQIVVDFAPISKKDRAILEQVIRAAFRPEGADINLAGWTTLGLFELTRRRDRLPLSEVLAGVAA
jgi:ribonuclease G